MSPTHPIGWGVIISNGYGDLVISCVSDLIVYVKFNNFNNLNII